MKVCKKSERVVEGYKNTGLKNGTVSHAEEGIGRKRLNGGLDNVLGEKVIRTT